MPLTSKGEEIKSAMEKEYGAKKGEQVFYASKNKGTISGVDSVAKKDSSNETDETPELADRLKKFESIAGMVDRLAHASGLFADRADAMMKRRDASGGRFTGNFSGGFGSGSESGRGKTQPKSQAVSKEQYEREEEEYRKKRKDWFEAPKSNPNKTMHADASMAGGTDPDAWAKTVAKGKSESEIQSLISAREASAKECDARSKDAKNSSEKKTWAADAQGNRWKAEALKKYL